MAPAGRGRREGSHLERVPSRAEARPREPVGARPNLEVSFRAWQTAPMRERMTIGQLAGSMGVADSTIRFYERVGLLRPAGRSPSNYRYYGPESADRLAFIRAAQAAGFELADIKSILAFQDGRVAPCAEVLSLVRTRLADVRGQLHKLRHVERVLIEFERACQRRPRAKGCPVLETLSPPARRAGAR